MTGTVCASPSPVEDRAGGRRATLVVAVVAALSLAAAWPGPAAAAGPAPTQHLVPRGQFGGRTGAVEVAGQRAFLATGDRLLMLDITIPAAPVVVTELGPAPAAITDVAVSGSRLLVAFGGLAFGEQAGISTEPTGLWVLEFGGKNLPRPLGLLRLDAQGRVSAVAGNSTGTVAYLAAGAAGLRIVDLSEPRQPRFVGRQSDEAGARALTLSGHYVLVTSLIGEVRVVDVADPRAPRDVGGLPQFDAAVALEISGSRAYVLSRFMVEVVDISRPTAPRMVGQAFLDQPALAMAVVRSRVFFSLDQGLLLALDFARPDDPQLLSFADAPAAVDLAVSSDRMYLAVPDDGLFVMDVSDPTLPIGLGTLVVPSTPVRMVTVGPKAYVADFQTGLHILDTTDPDHLQPIGSYQAPGLQDLDVAGEVAYLAAGNAGLRVVDVHDARWPREIAASDSGNGVLRVAVAGTTALVLEFDNNTGELTLRRLDVTDPANPRDLGELEPGRTGSVVSIAVQGTRAYLGTTGALRIVDLTAPERPRELGTFYTAPEGQSVQAIAMDGDYAYLALADAGLAVIDVSEPRNPVQVAGYRTTFPVNTVAAAAGNVVLGGIAQNDPNAGGLYRGLEVLRLAAGRWLEVGRFSAPAQDFSRSNLTAVALSGGQILFGAPGAGVQALTVFEGPSVYLPRVAR